ncbi:hypothetical protein G3O00_06935 [Burkholderia sp. Ac-20384]|uniref:hypothetical protein n=1 Tax=Burkholderia sp. Ac-20384 TaxID=2703902 RepID=UPI00197F5D92|nr:hypothetical protein [Burkholderia sp. Ac-20384]MBN3823352.1 hypothetical protein [Burkholderia sp. Ac-20384]
MPILELRILPPVAVGRLGAAATPLEAFDLVVDPDNPLDFRRIVPCTTLEVDPESGEIAKAYVPDTIRFKDENRKVRPVAPFLEVFARTSEAPHTLQPLTLQLLAAEQLDLDALHWDIHLGNIKIYRRTNDPNDKIHANLTGLKDHARHAMLGHCEHFRAGRHLPLGHVQFVKPTAQFPEIRLRYTPAAGIVYGTRLVRRTSDKERESELKPDPVIDRDDLLLYAETPGKWLGFREAGGPTKAHPAPTNPAQIFAGYADKDGNQVSWGYLDDECDGHVQVVLTKRDGSTLRAHGYIGAGPPAYAPDTMPVRVVSDEMEQILQGIHVPEESVSIDEATEIVLRALETIRLMNTAVMNGNPVNGRLNVASTMVRQNTADFERYYEPIAAESIVDNLALRALHERVFSTLAAGGAPWFARLLRQPEEIGDLTAEGLRKMPALMRGADGRSLTLTRRHINLVIKAARDAMFGQPDPKGDKHVG